MQNRTHELTRRHLFFLVSLFSAADSEYFAIVRIVCPGVYSPNYEKDIRAELIAIFKEAKRKRGIPFSVPEADAINIFQDVVDHHNSFSVYAYIPVDFAKMMPYVQGSKHKSTIITFIAHELGDSGWPLSSLGEKNLSEAAMVKRWKKTIMQQNG